MQALKMFRRAGGDVLMLAGRSTTHRSADPPLRVGMAHDGARQPRREAVGRGRHRFGDRNLRAGRAGGVRRVPGRGARAGTPKRCSRRISAQSSTPQARYAAAAGRLNYAPGRPV
jgi:hypothetical protein